jgi:NADPH-ferrihemoprotein reductase
MVRIDIQKGDMRLPPSSAIPIIGIGPGTGVAPMRALLEDRAVEDASGTLIRLEFSGCYQWI